MKWMGLWLVFWVGVNFLPHGVLAQVKLGSDRLAEQGFGPLKGKRVGLLTNPSGINPKGRTTIELLHQAPQVNLVALFGAEHGLDGKASAGTEVRNYTDSDTGLPVFSLYGPGPVRKPTPAMLENIDILVYDLQDTGARSYTFISSMGLAMDACGEAGVAFMVLDRPNPLGGMRVEGPLFNPRFKSLVGQWPIPYVYGMTSGELARMINGSGMIEHPCLLYVVPMLGWKRSMVWKDTGLKWRPTSPLVPHAHSPLYQVAMGMVAAANNVPGAAPTEGPPTPTQLSTLYFYTRDPSMPRNRRIRARAIQCYMWKRTPPPTPPALVSAEDHQVRSTPGGREHTSSRRASPARCSGQIRLTVTAVCPAGLSTRILAVRTPCTS